MKLTAKEIAEFPEWELREFLSKSKTCAFCNETKKESEYFCDDWRELCHEYENYTFSFGLSLLASSMGKNEKLSL